MCAKVTSIGLKGMEGYRLHVEVRTFIGNDSIRIVGLPDAAVKESKERILSALRSLGYTVNGQKIIINLSPSEQKKSGPMFDLPMAIGVLLSLNELDISIPENHGFLGALSLDGGIVPVEGMLPAVLAAKKLGIKRLYLPYDSKLPVLHFESLEIFYISTLNEVIENLEGRRKSLFTPKAVEVDIHHSESFIDFNQIIGHQGIKRALEVAAAGGHHVLMTGPPGCGKSMLAESFPSILPPLSKEAQLEMIALHQLSGTSYPNANNPPFRNPHHSASGISIIGGGTYPKPGEISLAHRGVLFLDEIAEFPKKTLDMLRQPFENGKITISRTHATLTYPASFILIAAMNPCPCGYAGSNTHYCTCTPRQTQTYTNRISGPLRDRFDIQLKIQPVNLEIEIKKREKSSISIQQRVETARTRQYERYGKELCNSRASYDILQKTTPLNREQQHLIHQLASKKNWSNRTQIKIIRLARSISDLEGETDITNESIQEALTLR
ncbi:YifB family Mg chelatase-like AAA ATPase [Neobacillus niacini]|uniref:YifB family Mg chelatase-like AAA ATPase n=1 Tax=Neobacillus niacini TaxID=86668 RepID=UPI003983865D